MEDWRLLADDFAPKDDDDRFDEDALWPLALLENPTLAGLADETLGERLDVLGDLLVPEEPVVLGDFVTRLGDFPLELSVLFEDDDCLL